MGYKEREGIIIPPGMTLVWKLYKAELTVQNIPMWLATGNKAGMFWQDLFSDKWCKRGNMQDNACYQTTALAKTVIQVLNPGMLGDFEPLMGCDTKIFNGQRVINSMCATCAKPAANDVVDLLKTEDSAAPMSSCSSYYKTVTGVTSNLAADSNLCGKTPYTGVRVRKYSGYAGSDDIQWHSHEELVHQGPMGRRTSTRNQRESTFQGCITRRNHVQSDTETH
jgi:hypothetical protein